MLLENPKTWDSRELFLPENNSKTCSAVNFQQKKRKKNQVLEALKPTRDMKLRLDFSCTCPSTHELNIIVLDT